VVSLLLPAIGFGLLVIGVRLMMLRNSLRRVGNVPVAIANQVMQEGSVVFVIGLFALLAGIFVSEGMVLINVGASLIYLGVLSFVQWTVQRGRGSKCQVYMWSWVTTSIGVVLIVAYVVYSIVT
jgi:hypothetical protein